MPQYVLCNISMSEKSFFSPSDQFTLSALNVLKQREFEAQLHPLVKVRGGGKAV